MKSVGATPLRNIILIGNEHFNLNTIINIVHYNCVQHGFVDPSRYFIDYGDQHIYYDFITLDEYDDMQISKIPINNANFISMLYGSLDILLKVLCQDNFPKDLYVDDDHGNITTIKEFIKRHIDK